MSSGNEESVYAIHSFLQSYGWFVLAAGSLGAYIYFKYIAPQLHSIKVENELRKQKKYDESVAESRRMEIEGARKRMQQQYDQQAEEERVRIQEKRKQKLLEGTPPVEANMLSSGKEKCRANSADPIEFIQSKISAKSVVVFSKSWCAFSRKAKQALSSFRLKDENYDIIELDEWRNEKAAENVQKALFSLTNNGSSPWVFADAKYIGGADECVVACRDGSLENLLARAKVSFLSTKH